MTRRGFWPLVLTWAVLLAGVLTLPSLMHSPDPGDDRTRYTVRVSLLFYTAALVLMLRMKREDWRLPRYLEPARMLWTLAWGAFLVHLAMAFHYYHHWSHADAVRRTAEVSGVGEGVYLSYLFTALWGVDVGYWWRQPDRYAARRAWVDYALHGFMLFIVFNASVVYEQGLIRWLGLAMFGLLAAVGCRRLLAARGEKWTDSSTAPG